MELPSFKFPALDKTILAALLTGALAVLLALVVWLLRRPIRAGLTRAFAWLRTAVVGLAQTSENIATKTQTRARLTYDEARPRVQAAVAAFVAQINAYGFSPSRFAAITLPLLVLTIFLFGTMPSAVVFLFAPLAGIGLFADYRSRRAQADNPSGRIFSPLRFVAIILPLLFLATYTLDNYSVLTVIPVVALLSFFRVFDAPAKATNSLSERFSSFRITPITVPLVILTFIYLTLVIPFLLNALLITVTSPINVASPINVPRASFLPYNTWALLAVLYLDYIFVFRSTAVNRNDVVKILFPVCLMIGGMVSIFFDLNIMSSWGDPSFPIILLILPLGMSLLGIVSLLTSILVIFLFLLLLTSPVLLLFKLINAFALERQRVRHSTTGIYASLRTFWHWLVGIPSPPILPDDSKGSRFASPEEISRAIAASTADLR